MPAFSLGVRTTEVRLRAPTAKLLAPLQNYQTVRSTKKEVIPASFSPRPPRA